MKIAIACDHGAFGVREHLIPFITQLGHTIVDFGTKTEDRCDYPDHGIPAAQSVANGECDRAILVCTTGIGMSICANKVKGIRAALVFNDTCAEMTRRHNDTNVLCLGAGHFTSSQLQSFTKIWLETAFEGGRHAQRLDKIPD